jgi:hypothetical protein
MERAGPEFEPTTVQHGEAMDPAQCGVEAGTCSETPSLASASRPSCHRNSLALEICSSHPAQISEFWGTGASSRAHLCQEKPLGSSSQPWSLHVYLSF